jgi:hypothetical protein
MGMAMENISHKDLFKDYYLNNKGKLFKSFEISINKFHYSYDIYWGDPDIIFNKEVSIESFPLAVAIMPHRYNYPNSRIFLHDKLEKKYNNVFETVIAHEIGHLWLHDIIGFNNPSTDTFMNESESEIWADYFAYSFCKKYRNINCIESFGKILWEIGNFQMELYNLDFNRYMDIVYTKKLEILEVAEGDINYGLKNGNKIIIHMINAIEMTLNNLGDIFT